MNEIAIEAKCTGRGDEEFVGIRLATRDGKPVVKAFFPYGYRYSEVQDALRKESYALLQLLARFGAGVKSPFDGGQDTAEFPFDAYIEIIRSFLQYGYYTESETRYATAAVGRVDWKRTIGQIRPQAQNNSPIYTQFVIRKQEKRTDKLLSLLHEWCVFEAFTALGWLFTPFIPQRPQLRIDRTRIDNRYIFAVRDARKSTFNDRNKRLFDALLAMLSYKSHAAVDGFFLGTNHFHTVWEKAIDLTYGIPESEKRQYFPPAEWVIEGETKSANRLRPDTIMRRKHICS